MEVGITWTREGDRKETSLHLFSFVHFYFLFKKFFKLLYFFLPVLLRYN